MREKFWVWIAAALFALFSLQVVGGMWDNSATYDEVAHLPAGYSYIKKGDYRFNPEHPPFAKIFAAIPLLFMFIPSIEENPHWDSDNEWKFGRYFLYSSGIDADRALFYGRIMMALLALCLAFLVFTWSKELYGIKAGVFSIFLFACEPNLIANSQVIHTDLGFSLFMASSLYFLWKAMVNSSKAKFMMAGLFLGLALATKFTALILLPFFFLFIVLSLLERAGAIISSGSPFKEKDRASFRQHLYFILFAFPLFILIAFLVLAICYGFSSIGRYIDGLAFVWNHNRRGNPAFLFGSYSDFGWWYYFPLALLIKTPIPIIIFFLLSISLFVKDGLKLFIRKGSHPENARDKYPGGESHCSNELYLLLSIFLFILLCLFSSINIGIRHILPIYPLIMIFCGRITGYLFTSAKKLFVTTALMIWLALSSLFIFPYHLSYFNELVMGPSQGYKYLVDSSLDWGQDLIRLKKFLNSEGEDSLILSYLGSADPNYYGIKYQYLPGYGLNHPQDYEITFKEKEFIAISATNLQSVFFNLHDTYDWLKEKDPYARIGYTIFVYEISKDAHAHRNLARLYSEFGFKDLALRHSSRWQQFFAPESKSGEN